MRPAKKMMPTTTQQEFHDHELRRGPWTLDEDNLLIQYITSHGEGRWNSVAKSSGLKRTGKSCRLRWLNYLKPDVKRGNLTPQEQLLILDLHSKWGNRWSKIAQHLPGRTDNEIKNYWRTRVQKQARHLKIDSNSKRFVEALRRFWMPRLLEKVDQTTTTTAAATSSSSSSTCDHQTPLKYAKENPASPQMDCTHSGSTIGSSHLPQTTPNDCYYVDVTNFDTVGFNQFDMQAAMGSASEFHMAESDWMSDDLADATFWNIDELWQFKK